MTNPYAWADSGMDSSAFDEDHQTMRDMFSAGYTMSDIAARWGISVQRASAIVHEPLRDSEEDTP